MGAHRHTTPSKRKSFDPAVIYDPSARRRRSPTKPPSLPTRFPDDEHALQPLRRLQLAKLQQNALPPPSPSSSSASLSSRTSRKPRQRIATITDPQLWVNHSPPGELTDRCEENKLQEATEAERGIVEEKENHNSQQRDHAQEKRIQQDYSLYLYLANKYGALDAVLYSSTACPGRLYARRIDQHVRRLQKWQRERLAALRRYWIVRLSREITETSLYEGLAQIQVAGAHQRQAAVFLTRLRWRVAARAFRSWFDFSQQQIEVRWRFQFALQENLRSRFVKWRERIMHVQEFKKQLTQVARRKRLAHVMIQWIEWKCRHQKLRDQLQLQWTKRKRKCFAEWKTFAHMSQALRRAVIQIQGQWRGFQQRRRYWRTKQAVNTITRVAKGFLARQFVMALRVQQAVTEAMEKIRRTLVWEDLCKDLQHKRAQAVEHELVRAKRQARFIQDAASHAVDWVKSELDKVKKNPTHHQLQHKLYQLQNEGLPAAIDARVPRTQEVLIRYATQLLLEEAATEARRSAVTEFLNQRDARGQFCNRSVTRDLQCVICSVSANYSYAWAVPRPPCSHAESIHRLISTSGMGRLRQAYDEILDEQSAHDEVIRHQLAGD